MIYYKNILISPGVILLLNYLPCKLNSASNKQAEVCLSKKKKLSVQKPPLKLCQAARYCSKIFSRAAARQPASI